jgi:acetyl esterase/lipase
LIKSCSVFSYITLLAFASLAAIHSSFAAYVHPPTMRGGESFTHGIEVADKAVFTFQAATQPRLSSGGVTRLSSLVYATPAGSGPLTLDLYLPDRSAHKRPLIVYVHGGGWSAGNARVAGAFKDFPTVLSRFAARGYVVASLNYRVDEGVTFPAAIDDVRAAIDWLQARHQDYAIDTGRLAIWGGSAGAQIAALAALSCDLKVEHQEPCAKALIAWFGVFDFATLLDDPRFPAIGQAARQYLGCPQGHCALPSAAASPVGYVGKMPPSVLLIHGTADKVVPWQQSQQMLTVLQQQHGQATLLLIPDVGHSFVGADQRTTEAANYKALDATLDFLDAHL